MYLLAIGLEIISTFTIFTCLPPGRTFLSASLMLVTTKVTVNFHTFVAFVCMSVVRFLTSKGFLDQVSESLCSLLSMNWRSWSCL